MLNKKINSDREPTIFKTLLVISVSKFTLDNILTLKGNDIFRFNNKHLKLKLWLECIIYLEPHIKNAVLSSVPVKSNRGCLIVG